MKNGYQIAFHGSPHAFEAFSLASAGSGEGAADYGWGLYFTSSKEVAGYYTGDQGVAGSPVPALYEIDGVRTVRGTPEQKAADLVHSIGIKGARRLAAEMYKDATEGHDWTSQKGEAYYKGIVDVLSSIRSASQVKKTKGNLYEVVIPDTSSLLGWDEPLTEKMVQLCSQIDVSLEVGPETTGRHLYHCLSKKLGSAKKASEALLGAGLLGVSYRGDQGVGAMNFVIFDDQFVALLSRTSAGRKVSILDTDGLSLPNIAADANPRNKPRRRGP
jgi:hypothetical protein